MYTYSSGSPGTFADGPAPLTPKEEGGVEPKTTVAAPANGGLFGLPMPVVAGVGLLALFWLTRRGRRRRR